MTDPGSPGVRVARLSAAGVDDYLAFFDGPAFADHPEWAKCYCHYYHVATAIDWSTLGRDENRTAMRARIEVGEMDGFLAREGDRVVGWLNAQARHRLPHCFARMGIAPTPLPCADYEAASIVCFVIDPGQRRRGIARALLRGACRSFAARGFRLIEGYPFRAHGDSPSDHYHGPLSLFLAEGFAVYREDEKLTVVRRELASG